MTTKAYHINKFISFESWKAKLGLSLILAIATVMPAFSGETTLTFNKIVDTTTAIPGGNGALFNFGNSDKPAIDGSWVVFRSSDGSVWRTTPQGRQLKRLISPNTRIPGGWGKFRQYFGNYIRIAGDKLVIIADNCGGCGSGVGIFVRSVLGGPITKLVDKHDTYSGFLGEDKNFHGFVPDFRADGDNVVFSNRQEIFTVPIAGGDIVPIAGQKDKDFAPPSPYCCSFDNPSLKSKYVFLRGGNVYGRTELFTVALSGASSSYRVVAGYGGQAPYTPEGYGFDDFEFFNPIADKRLVFGAGSAYLNEPFNNPYIFGIYSYSNDVLLRLADSSTPIPGGAGTFGRFEWFGTKSPIVANNGLVVFGAIDESGKPGLYAVRESGGAIKKIIAKGDALGDYFVDYLNIDRQALSGSTLVFLVGYANYQGSGIYSVDLSSLNR